VNFCAVITCYYNLKQSLTQFYYYIDVFIKTSLLVLSVVVASKCEVGDLIV